MSDILSNDLVRKYFGCENVGGSEVCTKRNICNECMAFRVLKSMQEPIRKGERFLFWNGHEGEERINYPNDSIDGGGYHPHYLRLPDRFQTAGKKECGNLFLTCSCGMRVDHKPAQPPPLPWKCVMHPVGITCSLCKPAEPEKCSHCTGVLEKHQMAHWDGCLYKCHKPSYAVEAKIKEIIGEAHNFRISLSYETLYGKLRELVELARR